MRDKNKTKIAVAVLNGLKMVAATTLFSKELTDLYSTDDSKKLFYKCRLLVHDFCKKRNLEGYERVRIQDAHHGAHDAYVDSLAFNRDKFLTKEELADFSYLGDLGDVDIKKIEAMKNKSIADGKAARTAVKCAKKILENQVFLIPDEEDIDRAIDNLKIAKKRAKKGAMDLIAVVEALQSLSDESKVTICSAKVLIEKHRFANG